MNGWRWRPSTGRLPCFRARRMPSHGSPPRGTSTAGAPLRWWRDGHIRAGGVMATPEVTREAIWSFDLAEQTVRDLNAQLHAGSIADATSARLVVLNPGGRHAIA